MKEHNIAIRKKHKVIFLEQILNLNMNIIPSIRIKMSNDICKQK